MNFSEARQLFPGLQNVRYFNTSSYAIGNILAQNAYQEVIQEWVNGIFNYQVAEEAGEEALRLFAAVIGAKKEEIAIVPSVSEAAERVVSQIKTAKTGENIIVADCEFTSNFSPWVLLRNIGYEIRIVKTKDGILEEDSFDELADAKTCLIAVSAVQSSSGFKVNWKILAEIAKKSNAILFVDACQAAGAIPIDVIRDGIDILATASHKFLLGTRGMGYLYIKEELLNDFNPAAPGWKSAQFPLKSFYGPEMVLSETASRFDASLAWFPSMADKASLKLLTDVGLNNIHKRNLELARYLIDKLMEKQVINKDYRWSQSTIFSIPIHRSEKTIENFKERNIIASIRAGKLRIALHFYNNERDIDQLVDAIE